MAESFVYPTVISLPLGYSCTVVPPVDQIAGRLAREDADLQLSHRVICDGEVVLESTLALDYRGRRLQGEAPAPFVVPDGVDAGRMHPAFLELSVASPNGAAVFRSKAVFGLYSIYAKPGKKSFLSDNAYKYGAPPVISMMARFRRFVDTYPVVRIDRDRDIGESLTLINPYHKPVLAQAIAEDDRSALRLRVPALSARNLSLAALLGDDERSWTGQVQLTANNRIIVFDIKHSLADPRVIFDHEHLDPFRADSTHIPATLALRRNVSRLFTGR